MIKYSKRVTKRKVRKKEKGIKKGKKQKMRGIDIKNVYILYSIS